MRPRLWRLDFERPASALGWWFSKLWFYNLGLVVAGIMAGALAGIISQWKWDKISAAALAHGELPELNLFLSGAMYLVMMVIANLCYQAGPVAEMIVRPRDRARFRRLLYRTGFLFSFFLPFAAPLSVLITYW